VPQITEWTQPSINAVFETNNLTFKTSNSVFGTNNSTFNASKVDFQYPVSRFSRLSRASQVEIFAGDRWDVGELCNFSGKLGDSIVDYSYIRLSSSHCHHWDFACPLCLPGGWCE
jgi:hypothetical protein